ncbi:DNA-binding MarR family transcriptional regulator [Paenibacillus sp. DS2015]|uniref:MarR family winged helix-turn-helix transcriptional regulator n=1 Tax=Paenibacillus sp. DS2015 TaxID=3373917 RepID=UPI003D1C6FF9
MAREVEHESRHWIERYMTASMIMTKRFQGEISGVIGQELTSDQYQLLRLIYLEGANCTSTVLAEQFYVGKSSITAMTNRLVEYGMIERTRDESDRRQVYLSLSKYGHKIYTEAESQVQKMVSDYLVHFTQQDIETFITLYERLAHLVQDTGTGGENKI